MKRQIAKFFGLTFSALLIVNTLSGCSSATVENGEHSEHSGKQRPLRAWNGGKRRGRGQLVC